MRSGGCRRRRLSDGSCARHSINLFLHANAMRQRRDRGVRHGATGHDTSRSQSRGSSCLRKLSMQRSAARTVIAGADASPHEALELVGTLKAQRQFGTARKMLESLNQRRVFVRALDEQSHLRLKTAQQLALCTYKDPDLQVDLKYARALARAGEACEQASDRRRRLQYVLGRSRDLPVHGGVGSEERESARPTLLPLPAAGPDPAVDAKVYRSVGAPANGQGLAITTCTRKNQIGAQAPDLARATS